MPDISHMDRTKDLRSRGDKTVMVKKSGANVAAEETKNFVKVETMDPLIEEYCKIYPKDLAERLGVDRDQLPAALAIPTLLNPLFGTRHKIVGSGLMTERQYILARSSLLRKMQDILDDKFPVLVESSSSEDEDEDGVMVDRDNSNYNRAVEELERFERFKKSKYRPEIEMVTAKVLKGPGGELVIGPAKSPGKNLPSGKNLFQYVDSRGRFKILPFFSHHQESKHFPTLWIIAQGETCRRVCEVACERFFGLAGYLSSPRRSRMGVRTYERLAMLSVIINNVYIDNEWVANEYLRRCKNGSWKKENEVASLKCWNLERVIEAEMLGKERPEDLTMEDLLREE